MPLFLTILEGASPQQAAPLLATQEPQLIQQFVRELMNRLGEEGPGRLIPLRPRAKEREWSAGKTSGRGEMAAEERPNDT